MLRLANRTARAATAGLLGLLVAAPPPSRADDEDEGKRPRGTIARHHPDRDDERHDGNRRDDRNDRRRYDSGRNFRRDRVERVAPRDRHEWDSRPDRRRVPPPVVWRDRDRERHDRDDWRDDRREWLRERERREEWREHQEWRQTRWVPQQADHWHWHGDHWCPPGHRTPPGRRIGWVRSHDDWRWARYRRPVIVHSGFYCAQCAHWFDDRYAFDRHVYGHHHLPPFAFGDAVAQMVWGLVYFGP